MKFFCVLLNLLLSFSVASQFKNLKFENIDTSDGLSSSTCIEIFQDLDGYMWFGTIDGLNKYNGYDLEVFRPVLNDTSSISNIRVNSMIDDKKGNLWIGTNNGLNFFNKETNRFSRINIFKKSTLTLNKSEVINKLLFDELTNTIWVATNNGVVKIILNDVNSDLAKLNIQHYIHYQSNVNSIDNNNVNIILKDKENTIWIGTNGSHLNRYNKEKNNFERVIIQNQKTYLLNHIPKRVFIDRDSDFWIGNDLSNLILWKKKKNTFTHFSISKEPIPVNDFYQDENEVIWISTDGHGLLFFDKKTGKLLDRLVENSSDPFSLPNNQPTKIFEDKDGIYWIGSYDKGVSKLDKSKSVFGHYYYQSNNLKGLNGKIIQSVLEDSKQRIWLSAYNGGLNLFEEEKNTFKHFEHDPSTKNSISSNKILNSFEGSDGSIWLSTYDGGLNRFNPETFKVERFLHNTKDSLSIGQNSVFSAVEDSKNRIWLGLKSEGINVYIPNTRNFYRFKHGDNNVHNLPSNFVKSLFVDSKNRLFVGTNLGLRVLELNSFDGLIPEKLNFISIARVNGIGINDIREDSLGNIWLSTENGIIKLDDELIVLNTYTSKNGLPNNLTLGTQEDEDNNIWIISKSGLSVLNPVTHYIKSFDVQNGIQGAEYQSKSIGKTKDGRIIAGGINGFNLFYPKDVSMKESVVLDPKITTFKLYNKILNSGDVVNDRIIIDKDISRIKNLILKHNENYLSFSFDALFFKNPKQVKYAYRMVGIDAEFVASGTNRTVNYSNLKPGDYTFEVKASIDEKWNNQTATAINIKILPPIWKTWWAYSVYCIMGSSLLLLFLFLYRRSIQESQKNKLDAMKIQFFVNVSHEFRTPLTLILNPLDKILSNFNDTEIIKSSALSAQRSARRLLHLVNQLLDYRKMDAGMSPLHLEKGDFVKFTKGVFELFNDLLVRKNITYEFESNSKKIISYFDFDKVEKIITNLISNAVKFTEDGGKIEVLIKVIASQENKSRTFFKRNKDKANQFIEVVVKDDGIGMDKEQLVNVFSRFYNSDSSNSGTGIGLNFTKALVEMHRGEIEVKSELNKGTEFVVRLPLSDGNEKKKIDNINSEYLLNSIKSAEYDVVTSSSDENLDKEYPAELDLKTIKVLIVEDNRELRALLRDDLKDDYKVIEAENGEKGLKMVAKYHPDIVISDVMMPKMDGFELCKSIKTNFDTCHIPVILLTARSREEDLVSGFKQGADAYLSKPFKTRVLRVRIQTLLETKDRLREKFSKLGAILPSNELTTNSLDESFVDKTTRIILDNIDNPDFKLDNLLTEVGIGRSHFFRKIQAITGHNPSSFIRTVRLKYASGLLLNTNYSIKEVAHMAGFNSSTYFGKSFKDLFNVTPREYIDNNKPE